MGNFNLSAIAIPTNRRSTQLNQQNMKIYLLFQAIRETVYIVAHRKYCTHATIITGQFLICNEDILLIQVCLHTVNLNKDFPFAGNSHKIIIITVWMVRVHLSTIITSISNKLMMRYFF